jgi:Protein of unknown function (DUF1573)
MMKVLILLSFAFLMVNCQNEGSVSKNGEEDRVTEIKVNPEKSISEIIRSPVNADEPVDTINVAKITFDEKRYDFGTINEGEIVKHIYKFTNTGKISLIINDARSTCGCTVPQWPKDPIKPGKSGEISVRFDSKGKKDYQAKPITITANTYPNQTFLQIKGTVIPNEKTN